MNKQDSINEKRKEPSTIMLKEVPTELYPIIDKRQLKEKLEKKKRLNQGQIVILLLKEAYLNNDQK